MKNQDFSYWIKSSLIVHAVVFFVFAVDIPFFSSNKEIKNSIRVDMIDLPDKVKNIKKTAKKKIKKVKKAKKLKPKSKKVSLRKKPLKKEVTKNIKKEVPQEAQEKRQIFKGNILAEGQGLEGLNRLSMERYYEEVGAAVKEHFVTPQWLESQELSAAIEVTLDEGGRIIKKAFVKYSGNELFDQQALEAVIKSEPLPSPPDRVKSLFYKIKFILKFPE